jgi:proteasome lid subunit RPN8/RPN11
MSTDDTREAAEHGQLPQSAAAPNLVDGETAGPVATPHDMEESDDESRITVFGELQPPNVHTEPFPQRLLHWKPVGEDEPRPAPVSVVVTQEVLKKVNQHVSQDLKKELGGFLLGNRYVCPNSKHTYVRIDICTEAKFASSTPVSMELVNNTFLHLCEEMSGKYRGKDVIGWYHSHPNHDVFLSPDDIRVHESRFKQDWMVALVVNPNRKIGAFFRRHDGVLRARAATDFYELLGIGVSPAITYVPWANYRSYDVETGQMIFPWPAEEEEQQQQTPTNVPAPAVPPWWLLPPQWLSLPQIKPAALVLGALMLGVVLYATLSSRDSRRPEPPVSPPGPEIVQLGAETAPSPQPDGEAVAAQTQSEQTQETEQTQEPEPQTPPAARTGNRKGNRTRPRASASHSAPISGRAAAAVASAATDHGNSGRHGKPSATANGVAVQIRIRRQPAASITAQGVGALGGKH